MLDFEAFEAEIREFIGGRYIAAEKVPENPEGFVTLDDVRKYLESRGLRNFDLVFDGRGNISIVKPIRKTEIKLVKVKT